MNQTENKRRCVLQDWVCELPFMQQSVLIAAMRGPDGVIKNHASKALCKWLRRSIVISAFDKRALENPYFPGGGSYTGPSLTSQDFSPEEGLLIALFDDSPGVDWEMPMKKVVKAFLDSQDDLPHHFYLHFLHAVEILGYKHSNERIRKWWNTTYQQMAHDMHLSVETEEQLDNRLNDNEKAWRADESRFKQ